MTLDNENLIFDIDNSFNVFDLTAKQFDTNSARSFTFQLIHNGSPFCLDGTSVKVGGVKADGKKIFNDVQIIDSANGIIELDLTSQMLAVDGILKLEFIFIKDNVRLSSYPFEIRIVPSVTNFNAIESSDEFGALTNALNSVEGTINNLTNKVESAIVDVKANKIGSVNLLDNTDLSKPIQMFYNTPNIQLIVDKSFEGQTSIYNENLIGLRSFDNKFGDSYTSLFRTNDRIIQPNTTYTISFNYMSLHEGEALSSSCFLYFNNNDGTQENLYMDVDLNSHGENWFKYVQTFTTPADIKNIEVRFGFRCTAFAWLAIDGLKLEKGTIATDYSLSNTDIKNKLEKASIDNAPIDHDCNSFTQPNSSFLWDTGLDGFKSTPLGDLAKGSAVVFEVINYGNDGRTQQEFRQTYPPNQARKWIRNYTSDSNGQWSDWRSEFIGDREINSNDDFNNITNMGCYKVQNINPFTKNSPLTLDNGIDNFGLLEVYVSGVSDNHRVLQVYYPHMPNAVGHRTPAIRMSNDNSWTDWAYIGATPKDIDRLTNQIASNSSSINDLYCWVNRNIGMQYISGATSLTLQPNWSYYLDGQHVADITHIDHSAIRPGEKVYFYVASGDPLAHIVFRRQGLCNQDVRVWLPCGQDFWIKGNENGDRIFTMMKIGDAMRFLS